MITKKTYKWSFFIISLFILQILLFNLWLKSNYVKRNEQFYYLTEQDHNMNNIYGNYLKGSFLLKNGTINKAAIFFDKAHKLDHNNAILLEHAFLSNMISGRIDNAITILDTNDNQLELEGVLAHLPLTILALKNRDFVKAKELLLHNNQYTIKVIDVIINNLLLSWCEVGLDNNDEAVNILNNLTLYLENKGFKDLNYITALQLAIINDYFVKSPNKAETYYNSLIYHYRHLKPTIIAMIANFYERNNQIDKAIKAYNVHDNIFQHNKIFQKNIDLLLNSNLHNDNKFIRDILQAISFTLVEFSYFFYSVEWYEEALLYSGIGNYLSSDNDFNLYFLGIANQQLKDYEYSNYYLKKIPSNSYLNLLAQHEVAFNKYKQGNNFMAMEMLHNILHGDDNYLKPIVTMAGLFHVNGNLRKSNALLTELIANKLYDDVDKIELLYFRANNYDLAGNRELAEQDYLKVLQIDPNNFSVMNDLAYNWINQDKNIEEAINLIEKAVLNNPKDASFMDSLGWALFKSGDYNKSLAYLEMATEISPINNIINDHLGDVYWFLDRKSEAVFQWQRALKYATKPKDIIVLNNKINNGL